MKSYYLLLLLFISCIFQAESTTEKTKQKYAGRCTSTTQYQKTWLYTQNATNFDDNKYSIISITRPAPELYCSNYTFNLPVDAAANITRIEVIIRRYAHLEVNDTQATPISDAEIQIKTQEGTLLSLLPTNAWTENIISASYGGASSTWSVESSWPSAALVNSESFGVGLSISPGSVLSTAFVDSVALKISWIEKECGDDILTGDEQCDGGVGCNSTCMCMPGYVPDEPVTRNCRLSCGDGIVNSETEECDGGIGCSSTCQCMEGYVRTDPPSENCEAFVPVNEGETPYYLGPTSSTPSDNRTKYPIIIAAILLSVGVLLIFLCRKKCVKIDKFGRKDADIDEDEDGMTMNAEGQTHEDVDLEDGDTYGADTDPGDDHDGDHHENGHDTGVTLKLPIGSNQQQPNPDGDKRV